MDKFKLYFITNCISFTILMVAYTVLSLLCIAPAPTEKIIFTLLGMTTCIAILMGLADFIRVKSAVMRSVIDLIIIFAVVFIISQVTGFIPFQKYPIYILVVLIMGFGIYFGTLGVILIQTQADAYQINRAIHKINSREKRNGHY